MNLQHAQTHAERFVHVNGYEATIVVHPQPDMSAPRTYSVRVAKKSIPPDELDAFFADARGDGLEYAPRTIASAEVWELT